jgi:phosphate-selective porin OprO/OprP
MIHGEPMKGLNYGLSVYQDGFSELSSDTSEDKGMAGRVVTNIASFAGISDTVLHVGLAASDEKYAVTPTTSSQTSAAAPDDARGTIISFRSEGRGLGTVYRAQIAGTEPGTASYSQPSATTAEVQKRLRGLELAAAYGPFKLQGEYVKADFAARHLAAGSSVNGEVKAWYAEALWMLTGEKYSDFYKSGAFGAIKPKSDFIHPSIAMSANAWGAWELGFRMSRFDASDVTTTNGAVADAGTAREQGSDQVRSYTAGIKWIVNPNVKFVLNYVRTDFDTPFAPIDVTGGVAEDSEREISLRGQVTF